MIPEVTGLGLPDARKARRTGHLALTFRLVLAPPPIPSGCPGATALVTLRFEDVSQDGRLVLEALPHSLQPIWAVFADNSSVRACHERGIIPILTRFVLEGEPGPFSAQVAVLSEANYRIARSDDGRVVLDMWAALSAPIGRTYDPQLAGAARWPAGRVFAEHVFTRPFAPPGDRRVEALDFDGAPDIGDQRATLSPPHRILTLPATARALDSELSLDPVPVTFGLVHTDSNLHVNSLAYIRIFEEAALRRFYERGKGSNVLGRRLDIAYRKPCFAGQRMRVAMQAFENDGALGIVAAIVDEASAAGVDHGRTHAYARMEFEA